MNLEQLVLNEFILGIIVGILFSLLVIIIINLKENSK